MISRVNPTTHVEWLGRDECLRLLATDCIGRLAVVVGREPTILPVNYALDGETVVFRSDPGTKVDHGRGAPVSFEIDGFDRTARTGWSVVVSGHIAEPPPFDREAQARIRAVPVEPWAGGDKDTWLRIVPTRITGRRVGPRPDDAEGS